MDPSDLYTSKVFIYQNIRVIADGEKLRFENISAELFNKNDQGEITGFNVMLDVRNEKGVITDVPVKIDVGLISTMTFSDSGEVIYYPLIFLNLDDEVVYNNKVLGTQKDLEGGVTIDFNDDFPEGRSLCGEWKKLMRRVYDPRDRELMKFPVPSCTDKKGVTTTYGDQKGADGNGKKGGGGKKGTGDGKGGGGDKKGGGDGKMNKFLIVLMVAVVISLILILLYFVFRKK